MLRTPPPIEDSTPLPTTAAAPSPATTGSSGENADAHNSDSNTVGAIPRKSRVVFAARTTHVPYASLHPTDFGAITLHP